MSDFDYGQKKADGQYERYPSSVRVDTRGRPDYVQPIRDSYRHTRCGCVTTMRGRDLCLTYATNPGFYSHTYCAQCRDHLPIAEFVWLPDGTPLHEVHGEPGRDLRQAV